ncbi:hypothetical protein EDB80DRAFT_251000 [Ilyonectria destructans]|nr:hypothetical protein EDB80DRAFT_251000 [Ilyonectria destructans]
MAINSNFYVKPDYVRRGGWTNWNGNAVSGGKITMGKNSADLVAIFIGIFIVFVEGGLWTLLTLFLFKWNRRRRLRRHAIQQQGNLDALYHQEMTILRNSDSATAIASAYLKLWSTWGFTNSRVAWRTLPLILLAVLSFLFFLIGVPFIAAFQLLENQGDEVLIQSPNCGFWLASLADDPVAGFNALRNQSWEAVTYVDSCYEGSAELALCDRFLPRRQLPVFSWTNGECPFDKKICLSKDKFPAFVMKTEVLDSHTDFGINAPKHERVKMQRTTTCAPLDVSKYTKIHGTDILGEKMTSLYFGKTPYSPQTYNVSSLQFVAKGSYNLDVVTNYMANGASYSATFEPITELQRDDADTSIIMLNNNGIPIPGINGPCSDPFFSATEKHLTLFPDYYLPDNPVTAIGCVDQYEFGNPVSREWTKPASWTDATSNITFIKGLSRRQASAYISIGWTAGLVGIGSDVMILGAEVLRARKYPGLVAGFQTPIPNDQWKKEVEYWFKIGLAKMQLLRLNIAMGPQDPNMPGLKNVLPVISAGRDDMVDIICSSQKIHNTEFKNFHRLGFITLAVIGGLLILLPTLVTKLLMSRLRHRDDSLAWATYGQLQLQRMATSGAGVQGWKGCDHDVPFLDPSNASVGDIDVTNKDSEDKPHPVWKGPDQEMKPGHGDDGESDEDEAVFLGRIPTHQTGSTAEVPLMVASQEDTAYHNTYR